ncbi:GAF and ANTAR domain-containing protein [Amycolatopsis benzoatilytica]|uniref:GAF and ANTAR domain-containing protein n=1 Tax=Amycolatopsis benzoatilytica TaxID=346045 RepID=UPI0003A15927|nr:GAF and ANTAR domain-containing protein [Amycolatopsis benzoatilytica]
MAGIGDFSAAMPESVAELLAALREGRDTAPPLAEVCRAATERLPVDGASVALMTDTRDRTLVYASDEVIKHLDSVQFSLGEGPCFEAVSTGRPVLAPDLAHDPQEAWPTFANEAGLAGVGAIFAFPLRHGAAMLGAMDAYRRDPGWLSEAELASVLNAADWVTSALLAVAAAAGDEMPVGIGPDRAVVHQATGMVIAEFTVPAAQALARLRGYAYARGRLLEDVAGDLVARRLHPREIET